jgi:hypothetical protein
MSLDDRRDHESQEPWWEEWTPTDEARWGIETAQWLGVLAALGCPEPHAEGERFRQELWFPLQVYLRRLVWTWLDWHHEPVAPEASRAWDVIQNPIRN